jgi:AcrR family transcriptional regulator
MSTPDLRSVFAEACLALAAERGWRGVTLFDIAERAGVSLAALYPLTPADAFDAADEHFDRAAAAEAERPDASALARDRVFEAAMARFEAMERSRAGVLALDAALERDPLSQGAAYARATRSARWLLALAGEGAEGIANAARVQALAIALTQARAAWRSDEDSDFARTMSSLDKSLRRAESFFEQVGRVADAFKQAGSGQRAGFGREKPADSSSPEGRPAG